MSVSRRGASKECGTRKFLGGRIGLDGEVDRCEDLGYQYLCNNRRFLNSVMGNDAQTTVRMRSRALQVSVRRRQYPAEQNEPNTQNAEE
jgi:hypothetical protein